MPIEIFGVSISDLVAIAAIVVSAFLFYVGHTSSKKSEQIRICREIWSRIEPQEEIFKNISMEDLSSNSDNRMKMVKSMDSLTNELEYFVYLAEKGEIKDSTVIEYYRKRLFPIFATAKFIDKKYPGTGEHSGTREILDLIKKYHKTTNKMKEYGEEFISTQNVKL